MHNIKTMKLIMTIGNVLQTNFRADLKLYSYGRTARKQTTAIWQKWRSVLRRHPDS